MKKIQKIGIKCLGAILLSCMSFGVIFCLSQFSLISNIAETVNDTITYRLQYQSNEHPGDIAIVKIDDKTLDAIGKSDLGMLAFDKGTYASGIKNIFDVYNAQVVGVDIVFANSSVLGVEDEQKLEQVLQEYQDRVVIASRSDYTPHPLCIYSGVTHGIINIDQTQKIREINLEYPNYDISHYCSSEDISTDNLDGAYIFSGEIMQKYIAVSSPLDANILSKGFQKFQNLYQKSGKIFIEYYRTEGNYTGTLGFESYSFSDILAGNQIDENGVPINLENKIVLIGEVGTIMHDSHFTPISRNFKMPGVEINANILQTLLSGDPISPGSTYFTFFIFLLINLVVVGSVFYFNFIGAFVILITSMLGITIFGATMFYLGEIFNTFLMLTSIALSYIIAYIYRFQVTDKSKRNLKKSFSLYVSPDVVHQITQDPMSVSTTGQKRELSIFFSDIVSFTSISESTKPEVLLELLNEYFSNMTAILLKNKGTLDKYIGDAVMGFFNAPVLQENHSYYACLTAIEQQQKLKELNMQWQKKGYPHIAIRIGIHTGEAIHGNIGSIDTRLNYTVIGDSVNLASRLEGIGKKYGIYICVSEDVYNLQKDQFHFRELDKITVKGKKVPVRIFELISKKGDKSYTSYVGEIVDTYQRALYLYYSEKYTEAIKILEIQRADVPSEKLIQRCEDALSGKIKINQGVFVMTEK